jgi:hypothetical protein
MHNKETIETIWAGIEGDSGVPEGSPMAPSEIAERERFSKRFNRGAQARVLSEDELVAITQAAWEKEKGGGTRILFPTGKTLLALAATILLTFGLTSAVVLYQNPVRWMTPQIGLVGGVKSLDQVPDEDVTNYTPREIKKVIRSFQSATQVKVDRRRDGIWKHEKVDLHVNEKAGGRLVVDATIGSRRFVQDYESLDAFRDGIESFSDEVATYLMEPETAP